MELFKNTNYDFLGKKWPFIIASLVLTVAGLISIGNEGRAQVRHRFQGRRPDDGEVRLCAAARQDPLGHGSSQIKGDVSVQNFTGATAQNEVEIGTELQEEAQLNINRQAMEDVLKATFGQPGSGKLDFNNTSAQSLADRLRDPLARAGVAMSEQQLQKLASDILDFAQQPALRTGHGFQPIVLRAGNEFWYYEHSSAGVLSGAFPRN